MTKTKPDVRSGAVVLEVDEPWYMGRLVIDGEGVREVWRGRFEVRERAPSQERRAEGKAEPCVPCEAARRAAVEAEERLGARGRDANSTEGMY